MTLRQDTKITLDRLFPAPTSRPCAHSTPPPHAPHSIPTTIPSPRPLSTSSGSLHAPLPTLPFNLLYVPTSPPLSRAHSMPSRPLPPHSPRAYSTPPTPLYAITPRPSHALSPTPPQPCLIHTPRPLHRPPASLPHARPSRRPSLQRRIQVERCDN
ncbi:uncharacterized protein LOC134769446 [Penaeus indicus]|uniref:uncharacterized protein LOC134769446 n=1 Tax=Penaeus indicus TaxID=29960 RepID=UPI00300C8C78